jgi:5'-nucleotidase
MPGRGLDPQGRPAPSSPGHAHQPPGLLPVIILLDMDGVLADFEQGFVRGWTARFPGQPPLDPRDRRHFSIRDDYPEHQGAMVQADYHAEGFFRDLTPMPGALDAARALVGLGHDVRICTSPLRHYRHCVPEKYEWIDAHLGPEFVNRMIVTRDKTLVRGDVLSMTTPTSPARSGVAARRVRPAVTSRSPARV